MAQSVRIAGRVDQMLHGYSRGHRRIATSHELPRHADRQIDILSDISGDKVVPGFETYLTGYPIESTELYALAMTWYAPEMPRPGSVWTHTLLIHWALLDRISDLSVLLRLFKRPSNSTPDPTEYEFPLAVDVNASIPSPAYDPPIGLACDPIIGTEVLYALYAMPDTPVIVPARAAGECQNLLVAIWGQQWPRLRRNFRFCTGSLDDRSSGAVQFDIQVVPTTALPRLRGLKNATVVSEHRPSPESHGRWLLPAFDDLFGTQPQSNWRAFLRRYSTGSRVPRAAFAPLSELYVDLCDSRKDSLAQAATNAVNRISALFPDRSSGTLVKHEILGDLLVAIDSRLTDDRRISGEAETDTKSGGSSASASVLANCLFKYTDSWSIETLRALVNVGRDSALSAELLRIRERSARLFRENRTLAIRTLEVASKRRTDLATEYLRGVAAVIGMEELLDLITVDPAVGAALVKIMPEMTQSSDFWRRIGESATPLAVTESIQDLQQTSYEAMLRGALMANSEPLTLLALSGLASSAAVALVSTLSDNLYLAGRLGNDVWDVLGELDPPIHRLVESSPVAAWFAAAIEKGTLDHVSPIEWYRQTTILSCPLSPDRCARAAAFLLSIGLRSGPNGDDLVVAHFADVHHEAANSRLSHDSWSLLATAAPPPRKGAEWDRCAQLRRALLVHFSDRDIDPAVVVSAIRGPGMLRLVVEDARERGAWRQLMKGVIEFANEEWNKPRGKKSGKVSLAEALLDVLFGKS